MIRYFYEKSREISMEFGIFQSAEKDGVIDTMDIDVTDRMDTTYI